MGSSQICNSDTADRKAEVEQVAFQHVNSHLENMVFCSEADLAQAAKSYFYQSVRTSGAGHLFREAYVEAKAQRIAKWWNEKHTASRTPRPHTKYTPAQALRGRQVAAIRKKGRADWLSLRAQLLRDRGAKLSAIAGELGCTVRTVSRLTKRQFPKLVGVVLAAFYGWTHRKSSCCSTPEIEDLGPKESLRRVHIDQARWPAGEQIDEIDRLGAAIPDILRGLWAAEPL